VKKTTIAALALATLVGAAEAQESPVKTGEAFIRKYDANGDGYVAFEEWKEPEQFKKADKNGDGRITIADFLAKAVAQGGDRMSMMMKRGNDRKLYVFEGFHTMPFYDRNHDGFLDEEELEFLIVLVMDHDEDRFLNAIEIKRSRTPPGLALEEGWFQKEAKTIDQNGDGVITPAEMRVPEQVQSGFDKNKDGRVSLEEIARAHIVNVLGGYLPRYHELSDAITRLGKLDRANWLGDPEMFRRIDEDKDGVVSVPEFDRYGRGIRNSLVLCNDFVTRHDLDGDQKVSRREFPGSDSMFQRMDRNHDGFVTVSDR
jgi:Ca2+-binding EF-hand superfamily protein